MTGPQVQAPVNNSLGTAGLAIACVGAAFSLVPLLGLFAWPISLGGLVLCVWGAVRIRKGQATNKGVVLAGFVVSTVALAYLGYWTWTLIASVGGMLGTLAP